MATDEKAGTEVGTVSGIKQNIDRIMLAKQKLADFLENNSSLVADGMSINEIVDEILALVDKRGAYNIVQNLLESGNTELAITDAGMPANELNSFITREIRGAYTNDQITEVGIYAFTECQELTEINFPRVVTIKKYAFRGCSKLSSISFPVVERIEDDAFWNTAIIEGNFPKATYVGFYAFSTKTVTKLEFSKLSRIGQFAFNGATQLDTLILRNSTICTLDNTTDTFAQTKIAAGTGYIYVPDNLVDSYKTATNWVTFANQIKPISELEGTI